MIKRIFTFTTVVLSFWGFVKAQNADIINLLTANKLITQAQADSFKADAALKQQEAEAKKKSFWVKAGENIQIGGYTHIRSRLINSAASPYDLDIRRARLDFKGALTQLWSYRLQFELAGAVPKLLDAYGEYKYNDAVNFMFGQTTIPFSLENSTSDAKLNVIDRSAVVDALCGRKGDVIGDNNGRDMGAQFYGSILKLNDVYLIDYKLAVLNGTGINVGDNNKFKDYAGRLVVRPISVLEIGISGLTGMYKKANTISRNRARVAYDINYELNALSLKAEYLRGVNGITSSESNVQSGYYVQLGYFVIPSALQVIAKYDTYDESISTISNSIYTRQLGVNYSISKNSRFQVAYNYITKDKIKGNFNSAILQLQVGF